MRLVVIAAALALVKTVYVIIISPKIDCPYNHIDKNMILQSVYLKAHLTRINHDKVTMAVLTRVK